MSTDDGIKNAFKTRGKAVIEWPGWGRKRNKQQGMSTIAELVPRALPKKQPEEARLAKMIALWE